MNNNNNSMRRKKRKSSNETVARRVAVRMELESSERKEPTAAAVGNELGRK